MEREAEAVFSFKTKKRHKKKHIHIPLGFFIRSLRIQQGGTSHGEWGHRTNALLKSQPSMIPKNVLCGFDNL